MVLAHKTLAELMPRGLFGRHAHLIFSETPFFAPSWRVRQAWRAVDVARVQLRRPAAQAASRPVLCAAFAPAPPVRLLHTRWPRRGAAVCSGDRAWQWRGDAGADYA